MKEVTIIIVTFNTRGFLEKCLEAISKSKLPVSMYEIIVVDNASRDQTVECLSKKYTQVDWISLKENLGFAKANNIGIRKSSTSKYVFFLNPDALIEVDILSKLRDFMDENKNVAIVTPYVHLLNGQIDDACHRGFPTPWNAFCYFFGLGNLFPKSLFFNGYHLGYRNLATAHEIDACAGSAMFVRRSAGEKVGWWDEDYFWYGEDLDFCYRVKRAGWKIVFYPHARVLHYKGVSGGIKQHTQAIATADSETKLTAMKARFAAMRIFYNKHYKENYPKILSWVVLLCIGFFELIRGRTN